VTRAAALRACLLRRGPRYPATMNAKIGARWCLVLTIGLPAMAGGCLGQIDGGAGATGTGGGTDTGTGGSALVSGTGGSGTGGTTNPLTAPPTCTSNMNWLGGNEGSANMNPGMACISCHASGGEGPRFTIAGTVYPTGHEPDGCYGASGTSGAQVVITGADGRTLTLTPSSAGNFSSSSSVAMPYNAKVVYMGRERAMGASQSTGDCNSCHTQNGANLAPGRIVLP
jgi:hypothetical protein